MSTAAQNPASLVVTGALANALGSHDVGYEINAVLVPGHDLVATRSQLNGNILAEFNAAGVQIMTPFYVSDPDEPKIAPPVDRDSNQVRDTQYSA